MTELSTVGSPRQEHSDEILERLLALHPKSIDLTLGRIERLLAALGHPERRTAPTIHIAGTNGKGSILAMLRAGLEGEAARVQAYTSPHLVRFRERIRLAGGPIAEAALAELLRECERVNDGAPITFFEITTAAAFLAFAREAADWLLLEVGLGGRLDATNVIARPRLTVISPVSIDHQRYLGDTVDAIAAEKAGILKPDVACVVSEQPPAAMTAIERAAEAVGAPLLVENRDWSARLENGRLIFEDEVGLLDLPRPSLPGRHQVSNAGATIAALKTLGAGEAAFDAAMTRAEWPARLQRLRRGALIEAAPPRSEIWLDGGHNAAAGAALAAHLAELNEDAPARLFLICGMLSSKDAAAFLAPFQGLARRVFALAIPDEAASLSAEELAGAAVGVGLAAQPVGSIEGALRAIAGEIANDLEEPTPRILICGSLHLAGRVLRDNA